MGGPVFRGSSGFPGREFLRFPCGWGFPPEAVSGRWVLGSWREGAGRPLEGLEGPEDPQLRAGGFPSEAPPGQCYPSFLQLLTQFSGRVNICWLELCSSQRLTTGASLASGVCRYLASLALTFIFSSSSPVLWHLQTSGRERRGHARRKHSRLPSWKQLPAAKEENLGVGEEPGRLARDASCATFSPRSPGQLIYLVCIMAVILSNYPLGFRELNIPLVLILCLLWHAVFQNN